jgi:AcrR family transcriptional regulator
MSGRILSQMSKPWTDTVESHRREVRDAILTTTVALVHKHGLLAVTMSHIAAETGIARATLYKHFPNVEAIVLEWHDRQISGHLEQLANARDRADGAGARVKAVLDAYARTIHDSSGHHGTELAAFVHRDSRLAQAQRQLRLMMRALLRDAAQTGDIRTDIDADELAGYCLHAVAAARTLRSKAAVRRLVAVTLDGLRPPA